MTKNVERKTLKRNLILYISLIILILCSALGVISFYISKNSMISSTEDLLKNKAYDSAQLVDEIINRYITNMETLSHLEHISNPQIPWKEKVTVLEKEADRLNYINLGIADPDASLSLIDGSTKDVKNEDYFTEAMEGNGFISKPFVSKDDDQELIAISTPIKYDGKIIGVLIGYKDAQSLYEIVENIDLGETGYAVIVDDNTDIVSHASRQIESEGHTELEDYITVESKAAKEAFMEMENRIREKAVDTTTFVEGSEAMYAGFAPIPSKDWAIMVVIAEKEILKDLQSLMSIIAGATLMAIVLGIILSNFMGNSITRPIRSLTRAAMNIVDLDLSKDLEDSLLEEKNEIGDLARGYQTIIDILRRFMEEVSDTSRQVATSSQELTAISYQATEASTSVAEATGDIAYSTENQLEEILNVVSSIEQISAQIENISHQSQEVNHISREVLDKANAGKDNILELTRQMKNIDRSSTNVRDSLNDISESSRRMDEIIEVIQNIAEQTNLLALNAAIEAARAGESGRGFAVVADEIRELAEDTQRSTEEIYLLLVENNNMIDAANVNMEASQEEVEQGIQAVDVTEATFEEISDLVVKAGEEIESSAKAIAEVAQNAASILESTSSLEDMSKDISSQTQNVSAATEEQTASMEEIAASSEALDQMAAQLQSFIERIKVKI